jgi:hypothetical protein
MGGGKGGWLKGQWRRQGDLVCLLYSTYLPHINRKRKNEIGHIPRGLE